MNKNVVQVHNTLLAGNVSKYLVHQSLKRGGGVAETEWEDFKLPQALAGDEGSLGSSLRSEGDLPISTAQVQRRKLGRPCHCVEGLINAWEGVGVLFGHFVKGSVIHTEPPIIFQLFRDHNDWGGPGAGGGLDESNLLHLSEGFVRFHLLGQREASRSHPDGLRISSVDVVLDKLCPAHIFL